MSALLRRLKARLRGARDLGWPAQAAFVRLWLQRALGIRRDRLPGGLPPDALVLFVCHGNILRSPMAAALFLDQTRKAGLEGLRVRSAGLAAVDGRGADPRGVAAAPEFGVSLTGHRATGMSAELVGQSDLIVLMDYLNEAELAARFPQGIPKTVLCGAFGPADPITGPVITDPYSGGPADVVASYRRLTAAVGGLTARLSREIPSLPARAGSA